jgi:hypothetical protein
VPLSATAAMTGRSRLALYKVLWTGRVSGIWLIWLIGDNAVSVDIEASGAGLGELVRELLLDGRDPGIEKHRH